MKSASLAILLKPKGRGKIGDEEEEADEDADEESSSEDYAALAAEAFPEEDWTPDRLAAFKELVMSCMGK